MAADSMDLGEPSRSRNGAGIGIAIAIGVTVGAVALLAPRLQEEMREDFFAGSAAVPPAPAAPSKGPSRALEAAPPVATAPATPTAPAAPAASLGPGESVVASAAPSPAARAESAPRQAHPRQATRGGAKSRAKKANPDASRQVVRAPASQPLRPEVHEVRAVPEIPLRSYREREPVPPPRRESREPPRREHPFDVRTWREHRNPDMPSSSPLDRQPG